MKSENLIVIKDTTYRVTESGYVVNKYGRPLVGYMCGNYVRHTIMVNKKRVSINTARVIYEAFRGEIPAGFEIDHIDGNPSNNAVYNLRAVSHKENMQNPNTRQKLRKPRRRYSIVYEQLD